MSSPSYPEVVYPLSECRWEPIKPKNQSFHANLKGLVHPAPVVLSVAFKNDSGNLFSAVRIVLCCNKELYNKKWGDWAIQYLRSRAETPENQSRIHEMHAARQCSLGRPVEVPLNNPSMPKCTVIFEMVDCQEGTQETIWLGPKLRASHDLRLAEQSSACILLDREFPLHPDSFAATLSFITHFKGTCNPMDIQTNLQLSGYYTVEVLPIITPSRQIPYKQLPVEVLLQIFRNIAETPKNRRWRRNLLSSALVCRGWICSLDLLLWDFHIPYNHHPLSPPDIHVLAKVVTERSVLAQSINHLSTDYFRRPLLLRVDSASLPAFTSSLIIILRTAINLQILDLKCLDTSQMETLGTVLCELPTLHTFSTGQRANCNLGVISIVQLAYCLSSWPSLKSLAAHRLQPPALTEPQAALRPPACTLTELHLERIFMTDAELMFLTRSSFSTLEKVTLDGIDISNAGLRTFLEGISQNISNLSLSKVGHGHGADERALDATIVKMRCLKRLVVKGDIATEVMVSRRSSLFRASRSNKGVGDGAPLPTISLFFDQVAGLPASIADEEWPGWVIDEPYTGWRCGGVRQSYTQEALKALRSRPEGYLRTILGHEPNRNSAT